MQPALLCIMRVFIVDDSQPMREMLIELLSEFPTAEVVGQCADALNVMDMIRNAMPDVVIVDMRLQRGNGLGVLGAIKKEMPSVTVIGLSGQVNPNFGKMCLSLGAAHYFHKCDGFQGLMDALSHEAIRCQYI